MARKKFPLLLTADEIKAIEERGLEHGLSRSEWLRMAALGYQGNQRHFAKNRKGVAILKWVYLNDSERESLEKKADRAGVTIAEFTRAAGLNYQPRWDA